MKQMVQTLLLVCLTLLLCTPVFALQVGDPAPEFQALSTHGVINLADVRQQGPVVLAFYYADFTPV